MTHESDEVRAERMERAVHRMDKELHRLDVVPLRSAIESIVGILSHLPEEQREEIVGCVSGTQFAVAIGDEDFLRQLAENDIEPPTEADRRSAGLAMSLTRAGYAAADGLMAHEGPHGHDG